MLGAPLAQRRRELRMRRAERVEVGILAALLGVEIMGEKRGGGEFFHAREKDNDSFAGSHFRLRARPPISDRQPVPCRVPRESVRMPSTNEETT
jgi:hypothetical protein